MISNRNNILNALKDEMLEKITATDTDYIIGVNSVERGLHLFDSVLNKPAVAIVITKDSKQTEVFSDGNYIRVMDLSFVLYSDTNGNDFDDLHSLCRDIEYYLENDCTYADKLNINDIVFYEDATSMSIAMAEISIDMIYEATITTP